MYIPAGAIDKTVKAIGEVIYILSDPTDTSTRTKTRGELRVVDASNWNLQKLGLRPDIDITANVPHDTVVAQGYTIERGTERYEVLRVEDHKGPRGGSAMKRLLLIRVGVIEQINDEA